MLKPTSPFLRMGAAACFVVCAGLFASACSGQSPAHEHAPHLFRHSSPIIGGVVDTEHDAVVMVLADNTGCSGTIVYFDGTYSYVLTAAHCFDDGPLDSVLIGDDLSAPDQVLPIEEHIIHEKYDAKNLREDFAMVRALGGGLVTSIPPLAPAADLLAPGTAIVHLGYGFISTPNGYSPLRHRADGTIDRVVPNQFDYQGPPGPCSGDSGGPQLIATPEGERVAGVTSHVTRNDCSGRAISSRVSSAYDTFIVPFIGADPNRLPPSTGGAGGTDNAGGAGGSATGGSATGGSDEDGFHAPDDDGDAGGCTVSRRSKADSPWLYAALMAAGGWALRRRRAGMLLTYVR